MKFMIIERKSLKCLFYALLAAVIAPAASKIAVYAALASRPLPIYCVEKAEKEIAVTFDSAWGNEDLPEILDALDKYGCKATFFVVGDFIDKYPDSVAEMHSRGHEIANHSDNHAHYSKLSREEMIEDMDKCDAKIKKITGSDNKIFRPPYGEYTDLSVKTCEETGRYSIQWDCDSLDWKGLMPNEMEQRIMKRVKNGSIILLHNGAKHTAKALPQILNALKNEGYKFKTVSELIYKDNYKIDHTGMQFIDKNQ